MEIEAKFSISDQELFQQLQRMDTVAGFHLSAPQTRQVHDTYLDTADYSLLAAGYACRRRTQTDNGDSTLKMTLKGLGQYQGAIHRHEEWEIILPTDLPPAEWPESPARNKILQFTRQEKLKPLFNLKQTRFKRTIYRQQEEQPIAILSLDQVKLSFNGQKQAFYELEAELLPPGSPDDLVMMVDDLREQYALEPEPQTKFERALIFLKQVSGEESLLRKFEQVKSDPPTRKKPPKRVKLRPKERVGEATRKTLALQFQHMLYHEPGVRLGEDIEAVHDMRVALRRMRSAFQITEGYLDRKIFAPLVKGLRRTGRALGRVRDMDVFWKKTELYLKEKENPPDLAPLRHAWEKQYAIEREKMLRYLDSQRYRQFKKRFHKVLATPGAGVLPVTWHKGSPSPHRLRDVVPVAIYQRYAAVRAFDEWVTQPDVSLERLHDLRLVIKSFRYTLEFFQDLLGPDGKRVIKKAKKLQSFLGDLQDAAVTTQILEDFLTWGVWKPKKKKRRQITPPPISAPDILAYQREKEAEIEQLRAVFPDQWGEIVSPKFRQLVAATVSTL